MPAAFQVQNCGLHGWAKPRASGCALALKCEPPFHPIQRSLSRDQFGGLPCLQLVRIAFKDRALGNTMRREDYWHRRSQLAVGFLPGNAEFLGERLNQQWLVVPRLNKIETQ